MALERSDSAGPLSAHLAILPEHFRLVSDCFSPGEPVGVGFPPGPVGEPPGVPGRFHRWRSTRRSERFCSEDVWRNGLLSCSRGIWRSTRSNRSSR
jgi:hypothetical protein